MGGYHVVWITGILLAVGCSRAPHVAVNRTDSPSSPAIAGVTHGDFVIGDAVIFENLAVFPISSLAPRTSDRFITLDEGLRAGTVKIMEVGAAGGMNQPANVDDDSNPVPARDVATINDDVATSDAIDPFGQPLAVEVDTDEAILNVDLDAPESGQQDEQHLGIGQAGQQVVEQVLDVEILQLDGSADVNKLLVLNTSGRPLYLMPGEVISGGQQDRTIGEELVIQPGDQPVPIDVFCVEQGRWSGRDVDGAVELLSTAVQSFGGHAAVVEGDVQQAAERANKGEFVASVGQLSKAARLAVQSDRDQGKVWEKVAEVNAQTGNAADSENFAANYGNAQIVAQLEPYLENCQDAVLSRPQVVGVAVAINGKLEAIDVFESTPLFKKLWPKLLKSYALDACTLSGEQRIARQCTPADCVAFIKQAEAANVGQVTSEGGLRQTKRESDHLVSFSVTDAMDESAAAGVGGGGFGGAVHSAAFAH